ncbi:hypothetical protein AKJ65_01165 [candidate division MSBL1 archaeon SCGC-AAA259E19]|uniref:tRNA (cytidine(56)-2'-O)-methyltransferase n=2 Tax=candidate division MSBL1 TaxID=215777 RepID=A0A133UA74_9EURY|nr:hypothetical protein AKJ64_04980 [candidate division MSBL1 archaeon SCGC-AAA259E17]KXA95685.1 hypothetical protein AKJ65_01165 [candidate division MSBL1 archaeon SCGC-AAA259E19]
MGHRPGRDRRISTHVALAARALGADGIIFSEYSAKKTKKSLEKVNRKWGGSFFVEGDENWREVIQDWHSSGGKVVHLSMYGLPLGEEVPKLRGDDILIIVGAEKVPSEVYELADLNISVGNQPHSEISAMAIFLDRFFDGKELGKNFSGAKRKIVPSNSGKEVKKVSD